MSSRSRDFIAREALSKLAECAVGLGGVALTKGGMPVAGILTKVLGRIFVSVAKSRFAEDRGIQREADRIANEFSARDASTIKSVILELSGVAESAMEPLEALARAVEDPDGIQEQELFREAMILLFDDAGTATADLTTLANKLEDLGRVEGPVAVGLRDLSVNVHVQTDSRGTESGPSRPSEATGGDDMPSQTDELRKLAICGSMRHTDAPVQLILDLEREIARILVETPFFILHGLQGVGRDIRIQMKETFDFTPDYTEFEGPRDQIVRPADVVLVVGGSTHTKNEVQLALTYGKPTIPIPCTMGAAKLCYERLKNERLKTTPSLCRQWMDDQSFRKLGRLRDAPTVARFVQDLLSQSIN